MEWLIVWVLAVAFGIPAVFAIVFVVTSVFAMVRIRQDGAWRRIAGGAARRFRLEQTSTIARGSVGGSEVEIVRRPNGAVGFQLRAGSALPVEIGTILLAEGRVATGDVDFDRAVMVAGPEIEARAALDLPTRSAWKRLRTALPDATLRGGVLEGSVADPGLRSDAFGVEVVDAMREVVAAVEDACRAPMERLQKTMVAERDPSARDSQRSFLLKLARSRPDARDLLAAMQGAGAGQLSLGAAGGELSEPAAAGAVSIAKKQST